MIGIFAKTFMTATRTMPDHRFRHDLPKLRLVRQDLPFRVQPEQRDD